MTALVTAGAELPEWRLGRQSRTDIVRYQGASGDFNPIHHDDDFARSGGMPSAFSVGMLQASYLGSYCTNLYGATSVRRLSVRFSDQVWPGDVLLCSGHVAEARVDAEAGVHRLELELRLRREQGGVAVSGQASVVVAVTA